MIMQLAIQVILLVWKTKALEQSPSLAKPNCQSLCGEISIPFPFGIGIDCYFNGWYEIVCNQTSSPPKPFLKSFDLEVLNISVQESRALVNWPIASSGCNGTAATSTSVDVNLEASPFAFSQSRTKFAAVGCDNLALLRVKGSVIGGCLSLCDQNKNSVRGNDCFGINCCQTTIPSDLREFSASIGSFNNSQSTEGCKFAFLVDQQWFADRLMYLQYLQAMKFVPVVLDWWVDGLTIEFPVIEQPWVNHPNFSCLSYNAVSSNVSKVQCFCNRGFEGNPYLPEGCQDIDECNNTDACPKPMICQNAVGGWICYPSEFRKDPFAVVITGIGTGFGLSLILIGVWWLHEAEKRRKNVKLKEKFFRRNGGLLLQQQLSSGTIKLFESKELQKATDNFSMHRKIGQGGQGTVYKGMLADGRIVAVKKSGIVSEGKIKKFINEVVVLSQINHRNVVRLLGCCLETEAPLLVYEFVPNGTFFQYLHDQKEEFPLTWDMRLRIATEVAGALSYLHSSASLPIYHRDIKSSNILLDEKHRAKIGDFGISKSVAIDQTHVTTQVQGTFGYLDPEYFQSSQFTEKSDVYSFGVVLVELLTRQKPNSSMRSEGDASLVLYFMLCVEENRLQDILDAEIMLQAEKEVIVAVANIAHRCLNINRKKRPTMKEVTKELESIQMLQNNFNANPQNFEQVEHVGSDISEAWHALSPSFHF